LSAESHVQVSIGISPRSLLDHNKVKLSGSKASARDLLEQSLQASHRNLYWRLIYDPSSMGYHLDIHSARIIVIESSAARSASGATAV
jgi:hypothetical protein